MDCLGVFLQARKLTFSPNLGFCAILRHSSLSNAVNSVMFNGVFEIYSILNSATLNESIKLALSFLVTSLYV